MINPALQNDVDAFRLGNSILKNPSLSKLGSKSFDEVLENKAKEVKEEVKGKASEVTEQDKNSKKKSKNLNELPDITQITRNAERANRPEVEKTYQLLDKFRKNKKSFDEDLSRGSRKQTMQNAYNAAGQPLVQPIHQRGSGKRMTRSHLLAKWMEFAPTVTEDITKRSVRLDIPMLNDVHALVLRMHPDRSISASLLGSEAMTKLIKENKEKLDKNLRTHHLSLREFNTYENELAFNSESGTRKQKKKGKPAKNTQLDLV